MKTENIQELIDRLERIKSPSKTRKLLDLRGRNCISKSMLKKAEDARKDAKNDKEIIENLKRKIKLLQVINGKLYMIYPKCYCHHLKKYKGTVPKCYCYCSERWVKQLFETALKRSVNVRIEKAVQWDDEKCMIRVDV